MDNRKVDVKRAGGIIHVLLTRIPRDRTPRTISKRKICIPFFVSKSSHGNKGVEIIYSGWSPVGILPPRSEKFYYPHITLHL